MDKILVIVDFQKDFYDKENGSLYVNGAENLVNNICEEIKNKDYVEVILTKDWHHKSDKSFKVNGGQWPVHCVQYSNGSHIHPAIWDALHKEHHRLIVREFQKGDIIDHEEYGAFENISDLGKKVAFANYGGTSTIIVPKVKFVVCGLAGDYCVWETYKNLKKAGLSVEPFYDGIGFIGEKFDYEKR